MAVRPLVSPTSACLRARTRAEHDRVEAALDLHRLRTPSGLAGVLLGWVAVWTQVRLALDEPGVARAATAELLGLSKQALDWLAADLTDLAPAVGEPVSAYPPPADARMLGRLLANPSASWGVAYVLRGSRLGGGVLAPVVRDALQLPGDCGTRFLASHGTDPGREWVSFRRRLDAIELPAAELTAAVEAARWTFRWVGAATLADSRRTVLAGPVAG